MLDMLLYVTTGLALALLLRKPAQRLFGAGPAFTLWLLPLLLAALPWLPALPVVWLERSTLQALPTAQAFTAQIVATAPASHWPQLLWLGGAAVGLLRLARQYGRLLRHCRHLPELMSRQLQRALGASDGRRLRLHPAGPAVLWAPRSLILLPADFLQRFDADERRLVLRHEATHLRRGDALWSRWPGRCCGFTRWPGWRDRGSGSTRSWPATSACCGTRHGTKRSTPAPCCTAPAWMPRRCSFPGSPSPN